MQEEKELEKKTEKLSNSSPNSQNCIPIPKGSYDRILDILDKAGVFKRQYGKTLEEMRYGSSRNVLDNRDKKE